ncbi:MAG: hypothetical protein KC468_21205, partial [Myxococcales bacterium]|nr:hypothetical protein [Myxococcales bacterium]
GLALAAAADYEALLLSPVAPLGSCSVVARTSQDRTLSTARGTEVVSDPTNVLAIECATRLRASPRAAARLCTIHQVLRAQPLRPVPGYTRHFRMLALAEAGRARAEDGFEVAAFARQLGVYARLLDACAARGWTATGRRIVVLARADASTLGDRVAAALTAVDPGAALERRELDAPYYDGLRVLYGASAPGTGDFLPLADLGRFDWVATLTSNHKLRYVASGCGILLIPQLFGGSAPRATSSGS